MLRVRFSAGVGGRDPAPSYAYKIMALEESSAMAWARVFEVAWLMFPI